MSTRSDRAAERKAVKKAEKDLKRAGSAARKAFDLKDPRFLGEAAVAATRGPVGLALFGASRGVQVLRERRAQQAEILEDLASDARQHAETIREKALVTASPPEKRTPKRRFAPLWVIGLIGGAAVAGAAAYFLREPSSSSPVAASPPATPPAPAPTPTSAPTAAAGAEAETSAESDTGEDLTMDAPDPEGPAGQQADTSPAAGSPAPGPAAGSAPQPSDDEPSAGPGSDN